MLPQPIHGLDALLIASILVIALSSLCIVNYPLSSVCIFHILVRLTVAPRSGTVLGGTAVQIAGLCFKETDTIICMFDGQETEGIYVSALVAVCVSPPLTSLGKVPLHLTVRSVSGTSVQGVGEFFSCELSHKHHFKIHTHTIS